MFFHKMESEVEVVFSGFRDFAKGHGLRATISQQRVLEILGSGFIMRVRTEDDRLQGVFVTLAREAQSSKREQEYALEHLVEFHGGSPEEVKNARGENLDSVLTLVKRHVLVVRILGSWNHIVPRRLLQPFQSFGLSQPTNGFEQSGLTKSRDALFGDSLPSR
jgi:hypothetical protein